ncbi:MAG: ATP-binding protein [Chitinophagaceae bacterium]|nr:ATP-binding protein [Chitinophagaceae bacterium]
MIKRQIQAQIEEKLFKGKAILVFGPRQVGKSTLIQAILTGKDHIYFTGDDSNDRQLLTDTALSSLKSIIGNKNIVFIDEAQRITTIGLTIKLIIDHLKDVQVIATGSSAFELTNKLNEPLTGRKYEYHLYPLSFQEMVSHHGLLAEKRLVSHRMVFGYYPEIITNSGEEKELLSLLANSYLYKDLLMLEQIKKPQLFEKLLKALALQIGSEVNFNELGRMLQTDNKTIEKYIDLLEKSFVLFRLPALNRNVRNEIVKGKKIYFLDCGVRNAIINDYNPIAIRQDKDALWENFIIAERVKFLHYNKLDVNQYFWRTTQHQEIDLIEEEGEILRAYEIKMNINQRVKFPVTFTSNYPSAELFKISQDNFDSMLTNPII